MDQEVPGPPRRYSAMPPLKFQKSSTPGKYFKLKFCAPLISWRFISYHCYLTCKV